MSVKRGYLGCCLARETSVYALGGTDGSSTIKSVEEYNVRRNRTKKTLNPKP